MKLQAWFGKSLDSESTQKVVVIFKQINYLISVHKTLFEEIIAGGDEFIKKKDAYREASRIALTDFPPTPAFLFKRKCKSDGRFIPYTEEYEEGIRLILFLSNELEKILLNIQISNRVKKRTVSKIFVFLKDTYDHIEEVSEKYSGSDKHWRYDYPYGDKNLPNEANLERGGMYASYEDKRKGIVRTVYGFDKKLFFEILLPLQVKIWTEAKKLVMFIK